MRRLNDNHLPGEETAAQQTRWARGNLLLSAALLICSVMLLWPLDLGEIAALILGFCAGGWLVIAGVSLKISR